ncbi:hypothetical protein KYK30_26855 [Shinella yambaruensis]|uniref:hypothetical protein n=1 Tax=Shinella yambaruensis TaxID=415996 RepID=UPI001FD2D5E9|nr:hypothetical protein [Shinella yambaruensis]MCJ8027453.1 hypothetical protein [Shinella yambaruensis]MCU7983336.1 hypothetical protein [Shinella yambaruensis]
MTKHRFRRLTFAAINAADEAAVEMPTWRMRTDKPAAIGLLLPANDTVIELEIRHFLPLPGVEVCSSRIPIVRDLAPAKPCGHGRGPAPDR